MDNLSECCNQPINQATCEICTGSGYADNQNYFSDPCWSCKGQGYRPICSECGLYQDLGD